MDRGVSRVYVPEGSGRKHDSFFVEDVDRWRRRSNGWKIDSLSKTRAHQVCQNRALVPPFEGPTTHFRVVNFNALLDILNNILEESFFRLQLIENSVNQ